MTPWHVDDDLLGAYAEGRLDQARAASVEQHLTGCATCRAASTPHADAALLARAWSDTVDTLDRPRVTLFERALRLLGVPAAAARLAAGASAAREAWVLGCCLVAGFALVAHGVDPRHGIGFLALAPLVPLTGVAVAYGPGPFPMHQVIDPTPYSRLRLILLRSLPVLPVTIALLGVGGLVVPGTAEAAAWLLPGLAMTALVLALEPVLGIGPVVTGLSMLWLGFVVTVRFGTGSADAAFSPIVQVFSLVIVLAAVYGALKTRRLS